MIAVEQEDDRCTASAGAMEVISKSIESGFDEHFPLFAVSNLCSRYEPGGKPILQNLSFELHAGSLTGVCGRTGSGKSTLALAMARAIEKVSGAMSIHGVDCAEIPLQIYRKLIQIYPQEPFVLSGSVRECLDPHGVYTDLKLNSILIDLNAAVGMESEQWTVSLSTKIESSGANLSAGQKQLLALARASLSIGAKVIILDEITSSLDREAAMRAINVIKTKLLVRGVAIILIAHSVADIMVCDEVFVFNDGRIIEKGTPSALLENDISAFSALVRSSK